MEDEGRHLPHHRYVDNGFVEWWKSLSPNGRIWTVVILIGVVIAIINAIGDTSDDTDHVRTANNSVVDEYSRFSDCFSDTFDVHGCVDLGFSPRGSYDNFDQCFDDTFELSFCSEYFEATALTVLPTYQTTPTTLFVAPPQQPRPAASNCNPNYSGCVPNASDVDCAGGSGNGPAYVSGPVQVLGSDPYGLDADYDGLGCE